MMRTAWDTVEALIAIASQSPAICRLLWRSLRLGHRRFEDVPGGKEEWERIRWCCIMPKQVREADERLRVTLTAMGKQDQYQKLHDALLKRYGII